MYINTGYLNHSHKDFKDKSRPLIVGSCGTYRLSQHPKMPTYRPRGRLDYQIIYISSGLVHFHFDNPENETIIPAGHIVLFRPKELQKYEFYGKDKTQIYWLHFTGSDVKNTLRKYGFTDNKRVFNVGTSLEYEQVFKRIRNEFLDSQMDTAITYFNTNYNRSINVEEYASSIGMSISWFIRSFRKYTGNTPVQFLTALRMTNAQVLLETTSYSINEIAGIVGYNNPLYFSRLFHKQKGCSPSEYRARNT